MSATLPKLSELPSNVEAEQAVLGSIMMNNLAYHAVSEILRAEHFCDPMHGAIFDASGKLINRGQEANAFSLKAYVETLPGLKDAGGVSYLAKLMGVSISTSDVVSMGRLVRDAALRRGVVRVASEAIAEVCRPTPDETAAEQIGVIEKRLYQLAEGHTDGGFSTFTQGLVAAVKGAETAHKRAGKLSGVTSGLRSLDRLLGGLHNSDLLILAGRPSMGKTALATNIATSAAKAFRTGDGPEGPVTIDGARVGFISLEMSTEQLVTRIIADQAGISSDKVRKGELNAAEFDRLLDASQALEALPLFIDDTPALSMSAIRARARRLKRQHGCELLVIDYLQMIEPDEKRRNGNRVEEVSAITKGLKALAKELGVPVLALSQLSRKVEERPDKRPQLADLRESGSIEQDADVVMFVYREAYYLERQGQDAGDLADKAEVLVEKQRHGPIGKIQLRFEGWLTRFSDLEVE